MTNGYEVRKKKSVALWLRCDGPRRSFRLTVALCSIIAHEKYGLSPAVPANTPGAYRRKWCLAHRLLDSIDHVHVAAPRAHGKCTLYARRSMCNSSRPQAAGQVAASCVRFIHVNTSSSSFENSNGEEQQTKRTQRTGDATRKDDHTAYPHNAVESF